MYDYVLQYGFDIESEKNIQNIKNYLKDNNIKDKERKWKPHITIDLYDCTNNNDSIEKQKEKLFNVGYPCKEFWNIVSNYNIKVLYGIDVHHRGQIILYNNLVALANEIIGEDVIKKLHFVKNNEIL